MCAESQIELQILVSEYALLVAEYGVCELGVK